MKQQQGREYQLDLFDTTIQDSLRLSPNRETVCGADDRKEFQVTGAGEQERALADNLMQVVLSPENLKRAHKQVKKNKGAAGVDQMLVGDFAAWYGGEGTPLLAQLYAETYQPQGVRELEIPKDNGKKRKLGIPTVRDRILQQAIAQVLSPIYEREFSDHSYGFRPKRSAHQALAKASHYVEEGSFIVVDLDLKTFFDLVNHDRLMYRLSKLIWDKPLLRLIKKYLQSGIMIGGFVSQRTEGTAQGSPLSPLLSDIVLDEMDKELKSRGHKFVRYADDCNILVQSQAAGERVMQSIRNFIEGKLKLIVNQDKSQVCFVNQTKYLGYTIQNTGSLSIAIKSLDKLKAKVRKITKRNRGVKFGTIISELSMSLRGWLQYFQYAKCKKVLYTLDCWIRRKLRCYRLKQCKRTFTLQKFLVGMGVPKWQSWILALSGKGQWRKSGCPQANQAMGNLWFEEQGLYNLTLNYNRLNNLRKPPCAKACTVV